MAQSKPKSIRRVNQLIAVQSLASFTQWLDIFLIFSMPVFLWGAKPQEIAVLAALFGLPSLILGPLVGAYLDRNNPFNLMFMGAIFRTILTFMLIFSWDIYIFGGLFFLKGIANLVYWPSSTIVINRLVVEPKRVGFFSIQSTVDQLLKISAPLLAGLIISNLNYSSVFVISAISSFLCCMLIPSLFIKEKIDLTKNKRDVTTLARDLFEGFKMTKSLENTLVISISFSLLISLSLAIFDPHLASFLKEEGYSSATFSILVSSTGLGAVIGAALVRLFMKNSQPLTLIYIGVSAYTLSMFILVVTIYVKTEPLELMHLAFIWVINGLGYEILLIGALVNIQNLCPKGMLGKISTSVRSFQMTCVILGPSLGAFIIVNSDRTMPFYVASCLSFIVFIVSSYVQLKPSRKTS